MRDCILLTDPFYSIQLPRRLYLCLVSKPLFRCLAMRMSHLASLGVLSPNWQSHLMSPSPVRAQIPQPSDVVTYFSSLVVLNLHRAQLGGEI